MMAAYEAAGPVAAAAIDQCRLGMVTGRRITKKPTSGGLDVGLIWQGTILLREGV
jgi:hypothetical protein